MAESAAPLLATLKAIVGEANVLTSDADVAPYVTDWRGRYRGRTRAVVRPSTTADVSAVVRCCLEHGAPIVPQGGNTGLCGGATPREDGAEVVVSLSRLTRVRAVDAGNATLTVEAGMPLARVQQAADDAGLLFPLSLAAEGSCTIGGNLATNAGGTAVLRYGNARELVLGLEVVLADGRIWDGLKGLRKDNTGYDLKHLFVGAEGTLGIITAAVLKLFPKPTAIATALVAVESPAQAVALLTRLRGRCGDRVTGYELIARICVDLVVAHMPATRDPFSERHPWYVLVELSDSGAREALDAMLEEALSGAAEDGLIRDAAIAASEAQRAAFWKIREDIPEAQKVEGASVKHDVSVPVSRVPELIERAGAALAKRFADVRVVAFGHVGDGNIHYNCSMLEGRADRNHISERQAADEFFAQAPEVNRVVYDVVHALGGSISAEHGLGVLKRDEIKRYKS